MAASNTPSANGHARASARTTAVIGRVTRNRSSIPRELSSPATQCPAYTSEWVMGNPLPHPTSSTRAPRGSAATAASASRTPTDPPRSVRYQSAIKSYSRMQQRRLLAARGETPPAFGRRCIPAGCVAPPLHIGHMLGRRALPAGRLAALGATSAFHHELLGDVVGVVRVAAGDGVAYHQAPRSRHGHGR